MKGKQQCVAPSILSLHFVVVLGRGKGREGGEGGVCPVLTSYLNLCCFSLYLTYLPEYRSHRSKGHSSNYYL